MAFVGTTTATAGDITATLVHTAGTQWGSNTSTNTVNNTDPLEVVDSIGAFSALAVNSNARLNLNHKTNQVVFANSSYIILQDESKDRIILNGMKLNVSNNDILTGSIAGTHAQTYNVNMMLPSDSTNLSTVVATKGEAIKVDGLSSVKATRDIMKNLKLCSLSNVNLYTYDNNRYVKDAAGDSIEILDIFNEDYVLPADTALKSITGIVFILTNATDTAYIMAPISNDGWEIAVSQYYKSFDTDEVFLPTTENITAGMVEGATWIEGGTTRVDNKTRTIDPETELEATTKSAPGIGLKMGNNAKSLTTYITDVKTLKAFGTTTSSSAARYLIVTATPTEGDVVTGEGLSENAQTVMVTLTLDPSKKYKVTYTGTNDAKDGGGDVALHGLKFISGGISTGIDAIQTKRITDRAVYNLNGQKMRNAGESLKGLNGLYIMNGQKVILK